MRWRLWLMNWLTDILIDSKISDDYVIAGKLLDVKIALLKIERRINNES